MGDPLTILIRFDDRTWRRYPFNIWGLREGADEGSFEGVGIVELGSYSLWMVDLSEMEVMFSASVGGSHVAYKGLGSAEGRKPVDDAYSVPVTVWVDAVTDPVELASIGATCRAPSDEAAKFVDGDLLIFADWLEAQGQHGDAARIREVHQLLAPAQGA